MCTRAKHYNNHRINDNNMGINIQLHTNIFMDIQKSNLSWDIIIIHYTIVGLYKNDIISIMWLLIQSIKFNLKKINNLVKLCNNYIAKFAI